MTLVISYYLSLLFEEKERPTTTFHQKYQHYRHSRCKKQSRLPFAITIRIIGPAPCTLPTDVFGNGTKTLKRICVRSEHRPLTWRLPLSSPLHLIIRYPQGLYC